MTLTPEQAQKRATAIMQPLADEARRLADENDALRARVAALEEAGDGLARLLRAALPEYVNEQHGLFARDAALARWRDASSGAVQAPGPGAAAPDSPTLAGVPVKDLYGPVERD